MLVAEDELWDTEDVEFCAYCGTPLIFYLLFLFGWLPLLTLILGLSKNVLFSLSLLDGFLVKWLM